MYRLRPSSPLSLRAFLLGTLLFFPRAAMAADVPAFDAPGVVALRYVNGIFADPIKALTDLAPTDQVRGVKPLAAEAQRRWGAPEGFEAPSFPSVLAEFTRGDWSLVWVRRTMKAKPKALQNLKKAHAAQIEKDFPAGERDCANKSIFWEGDTLHDDITVYLHRTDEKKEPWVVLPEYLEDVPMPGFLTDMRTQWGCYLSRWRNTDDIYWDETVRENAQKAEREKRAQELKRIKDERERKREDQANPTR